MPDTSSHISVSSPRFISTASPIHRAVEDLIPRRSLLLLFALATVNASCYGTPAALMAIRKFHYIDIYTELTIKKDGTCQEFTHGITKRNRSDASKGVSYVRDVPYAECTNREAYIISVRSGKRRKIYVEHVDIGTKPVDTSTSSCIIRLEIHNNIEGRKNRLYYDNGDVIVTTTTGNPASFGNRALLTRKEGYELINQLMPIHKMEWLQGGAFADDNSRGEADDSSGI